MSRDIFPFPLSSSYFLPLLPSHLRKRINTIRPLTKQLQREPLPNNLIPGLIRMQIVSRVIDRVQHAMVARVPQPFVKVNHRVECARVADEVVDPVP